MSYRTIQHRISAGQQFTGTAAAGALSRTHGIEDYAAAAAGGLFDFGHSVATPVRYIAIKFGGQSAWTLKLVDADGVVLGTVLSGTNETTKYAQLTDLVLMPGDKLKLETTGATTAMQARVTVATR